MSLSDAVRRTTRSVRGRTLRSFTAVAVCGLLAVGCQTVIEAGLPEGQANRMLVVLDQAGIGASKEPEGRRGKSTYEVRVAQDDVARALEVLRAQNLPRSEEPGFKEVFGQGSLVPTATEERGRYASALAGELARSIETIDGVLDARVHVAIPDARDFALDEARPKPRASVLVKYRAGRPPVEASAIRELVSGAVDGMDPKDVSVVAIAAPRRHSAGVRSLVQVGPVWVARSSADTLRAIFAGTAVAGMLLAVALVVLLRRRRNGARVPASAHSHATQER